METIQNVQVLTANPAVDVTERVDKERGNKRYVFGRKRVENVMTIPTVIESINTMRNLPNDMTDTEALVLMLAVHCTPEAVGLSIDPPLTGKQVREILTRYNSYFERLKKVGDDILKHILEDSMMIALARVRSALVRVPVNNVHMAKSMMSIFMDLRRIAMEMPKKTQNSITPATADRFAKLQSKFDVLADAIETSVAANGAA